MDHNTTGIQDIQLAHVLMVVCPPQTLKCVLIMMLLLFEFFHLYFGHSDHNKFHIEQYYFGNVSSVDPIVKE